MNNADKTIATALEQFPRKNLDRLVAHLAAGLPMTFDVGWDYRTGDPATCGCIMGVAFTPDEARATGVVNEEWPYRGLASFLIQYDPTPNTFSSVARARLAELVNAEMERREDLKAAATVDNPANRVMATSNPVEQTHDSAIIPSLEAVPVG